MALSAAFSMARIIIGVAKSGGCAIIVNLRRKDQPPPAGSSKKLSYFQSTACMKSSAARRKSSRDGQCCATAGRREDGHGLQARPPKEQCVDIALISAAIVVGLFAAYNLLHYMLFLLVTHPRDAGNIRHTLNEFEERQLVEWTPKAVDFLKHD